MKPYFCSQQEQVTAALQAGEWPEACDPALRAHVETCALCSDLVLVAQALRQSRTQAIQAPQLPSSGMLWWRAQVRRRNAAIERVIRPIAVAEKVAVLTASLAIAALVTWRHTQVVEWLSSVWTPFVTIGQMSALLFASLGTLLLFGGLAVYLITAKE